MHLLGDYWSTGLLYRRTGSVAFHMGLAPLHIHDLPYPKNNSDAYRISEGREQTVRKLPQRLIRGLMNIRDPLHPTYKLLRISLKVQSTEIEAAGGRTGVVRLMACLEVVAVLVECKAVLVAELTTYYLHCFAKTEKVHSANFAAKILHLRWAYFAEPLVAAEIHSNSSLNLNCMSSLLSYTYFVKGSPNYIDSTQVVN